MPTYLQDLDYSIHAIKSVTHQLKVVEDIDIANNRSLLTISIVRTNSGEEVDVKREAIKIVVNGETIKDIDGYWKTATVPANSTDEVLETTHYVTHNASGGGTFTVSVTYKTDSTDIIGLLEAYWTIGTAEISKSLTPIDRTAPTISDVSISADRYGRNAFVSFKASHSSYHLKEVEFKLNSMTEQQAKCRDLWYDAIRNGDIENPPTYVNKNYNGCNAEGDWYLRLYRVYPIGQEAEFYYPLDDVTDNLHPLESGKSYFYEIYATCINNVGIKIEGYLNVPQKVTGVTCESQLEISLGQSTELVYQVQPTNAEERSVTFQSTDTTVATVDKNGLITAVGDGVCQIIVTTVDGGSPDAVSGFSAACNVTVLNADVFPKLSEIRYLTIREIAMLSFACTFLHKKLLKKGVTVSDLSEVICKGRSHPVKEIKSLFETIETNCQLLKSASSSAYPTEALAIQRDIISQNTEKNWYFIVNEWIRFLNELNTQIEKEA